MHVQDGRGPTPPRQGSQEGSNPSRPREWEGRKPLPTAWRWWHSATLSHSGVSAVSLTLKPKRCDSNNLHPDKASTYATPRRKTISPSDSVWRVPNQWNAQRRSHHSRHWRKAHAMRAGECILHDILGSDCNGCVLKDVASVINKM